MVSRPFGAFRFLAVRTGRGRSHAGDWDWGPPGKEPRGGGQSVRRCSTHRSRPLPQELEADHGGPGGRTQRLGIAFLALCPFLEMMGGAFGPEGVLAGGGLSLRGVYTRPWGGPLASLGCHQSRNSGRWVTRR